MATSRKTVDYIIEQISRAGVVSARPMFGEYGLHRDGKMIGIIADEQLYIKPTEGGRALVTEATEAPPYPGAKPYLLIDADRWDDGEWLVEVVRVTAAGLPAPKAKGAKRARGAG